MSRNAIISKLGVLAQKREYGVLALLVVTFITVGSQNPAFFAPGNIKDMLVACAPVAIIACGMTFVLLLGEIDISVGSMMGLLAAVIGILTSPQHMGLPVGVGICITLLLGTGLGFINGLLVTFGKVPSIIVTLGMLTALRGITELLMAGRWITQLPPGLRVLGVGTILDVPVCIWVAVVVAAASILMARETPLGRRIYAVGSNSKAALVAGLPERRLKIFAFALTGFLTAVATLVSVPLLSVIESGIGNSLEMLVVTCVVVGGTSTNGGRGTIIGSILGVLLLVMVRTDLIFLRLGETSTYWERAIQGAFILVAVLIDHIARRRSNLEVAQ